MLRRGGVASRLRGAEAALGAERGAPARHVAPPTALKPSDSLGESQADPELTREEREHLSLPPE